MGILAVMRRQSARLCARPTLSRYSREPLPSQMPTPFSLSSLEFVAPEMNHRSSSTTPATLRWIGAALAAYRPRSDPKGEERLVEGKWLMLQASDYLMAASAGMLMMRGKHESMRRRGVGGRNHSSHLARTLASW